MGITLLGPVAVDGNGALGPRDRVVLAVLALRPGEAVDAGRLAEALWGETPPPSWNKVVPGCVMRLRRVLGVEAIETTPHGYRLRMPADEVDAHRFERLVGRGRKLLACGQADRAGHVLAEALALWQGRALAELRGWEPGRAEAARLEGMRLDAEEQRWAAELAAGRHEEVLSALSAGVAAAPLRERRWGQLALAEYRSGRQGDALRTIHRARTTLVTELGLNLSPELAALERAILVHDPALQAVTAGPQPSTDCPYLGLVPYDVGDAEVFFGRDREVAECVRRITAANLLTVAGPSGCGKSSLVRAGVAAALQRSGRVVTVITPGSHPMSSLADVEPDCALVVDQCEEATVLCPDPFERAAFFDAVAAHAAQQPVIVAIRADRLGDLTEHAGFARLVEVNLYLLGTMGDDDLRAAIEGPAGSAGLLLEPGLVHVLVHDVKGERGALPLLSHALSQTWERREGRTLTVDGYRQTGGIHGAVSRSAEALYEALPPEQRGLLRALLLRLVAITADGEPVRAAQVVVVGLSAGAVAAPLYAAAISDQLPDASITALADSSGAYPDASNPTIGELWGLGTMRAAFPEYTGDWSTPRHFVVAGLHDPDIVMGRVDYALDEAQATFLGQLGADARDVTAAIDANEALIEQVGVTQHSYTAPGDDHTPLESPEFYDLAVNDVALVDWVTALIAGTPMDDVHCEDCKIPG